MNSSRAMPSPCSSSKAWAVCQSLFFFPLREEWGGRGVLPFRTVVKTSPSNTDDAGSVHGQRAKVTYSSGQKTQNIKQKQYCNKFNKDFKNGPHQKKKKE